MRQMWSSSTDSPTQIKASQQLEIDRVVVTWDLELGIHPNQHVNGEFVYVFPFAKVEWLSDIRFSMPVSSDGAGAVDSKL